MITEADYYRTDHDREIWKERDLLAAELRAREERADLDERVEDLLPSSFAAEPTDERLLELAENCAQLCPWLASVGSDKLTASIARVAARRVCGAL